MTPVSGSTWAWTHASNSPTTIQGKRPTVTACPPRTRAKTTHDAANDAASAGTAIQCARRPVTRPKRRLRRAPASGQAGINQTAVDTRPIYRGGPGVSSKPPPEHVATDRGYFV